MKNFMEERGITHHMSCTNTSAQNGLAERKNRHLLKITRSLLFACNAPNHYWGDAVLKAAHLINHSPSRVLKFQTPHMLLKKRFPTVKFSANLPLKVFRSTCFVHNLAPNRSKLDLRSIRCMFLGYSSTQKGYKCYFPQQRKVYICQDFIFFEQVPFYPLVGQYRENNIQEVDPLWMTPMPHMLHLDLPQPPPENSTIHTRQQPLQN